MEQQPTNEVAVKRNNVKTLLEKYKGEIEKALPKHLTADRMLRVVLTAISRTPKLFECDQASLMGAVLTSSQLGLQPDGVLGEAYMIPFNNTRAGKMECQFLIGYRGYVALALRSGQVKSIQARAVKEGDDFMYEFGLDTVLKHVPKNPDGQITHFYAVIELMNGGKLFEVMTSKEVNFIRDKSANYAYAKDKSRTVWGQYYEEMGKKTVIRRAIKLAPLSPEINRAVGLDELAEVGKPQMTTDAVLDIPGADDLHESAYEEVSSVIKEEEEQKAAKSTDTANGAAQTTLDLLNAKTKAK